LFVFSCKIYEIADARLAASAKALPVETVHPLVVLIIAQAGVEGKRGTEEIPRKVLV